MEFQKFVRKPFVVEAIQVTKENIEDVAQYVGTIRETEDGTPYIHVDQRRVPNILRVFPGYWMTRMGSNIRCYSKRVFNDQFTDITPDIQSWVTFMTDGPHEPEPDPDAPVGSFSADN